jgi:anti-sigma B factor antagonist
VLDTAAPDPFGAGLPLETAVSRPRPGAVLLTVEGEVDTLTADALEAGLDAALEAASDEGGAAVVVDLSGVTFLASSGLAVLIGAAHRIESRSGDRLHVVASNRAVTRPLEVTGADTLLGTHADVGSALAAAGRPDIAPPPRGVAR